jgi:2-methylcitrate dehydratase
MPEQYQSDRIQQRDVQTLLRKVRVQPSQELSQRFPDEMPCRVFVTLRQGQRLVKEKKDYEGFRTRPMRWETVVEKFERLGTPYADRSQRQQIVEAVANLEAIQVGELARLLRNVRSPTVKIEGKRRVR